MRRKLKGTHMSRSKKSRSLKYANGGVKTGSKERTKLESKQRKAKKLAANPRKVTRTRSVYQKAVDVETTEEQQVQKRVPTDALDLSMAHPTTPKAKIKPEPQAEDETLIEEERVEKEAESEEDLWDLLENPSNTNTF